MLRLNVDWDPDAVFSEWSWAGCQQSVNINHRDKDWPSFASEIDDIKALCVSFQDLYITYISHSLNIFADTLAKDLDQENKASCL